MITRFIDTLVMLLGGLLMGWLLASGNARAPQTVAEQTSPAIAATEVQKGVDPPDESTTPAPGNCVAMPVATAVSEPGLRPMHAPLPDVYLAMIGGMRDGEPGPQPHDRYRAFAHDQRDESWASAMENGLLVWADQPTRVTRLVVDFVECRSRSCIIAGSSPQGDTIELDALRREPWWRADGAISNVVSTVVGQGTNFIVFIERYS